MFSFPTNLFILLQQYLILFIHAEQLPPPERIINGNETFVYDYPFLVYLAYRGTNEVFCAGSIVNRWAVLTAAHCVEDQDPIEMIAVAGYNKELRHMQTGNLKSYTMHPKFIDTTKTNATDVEKNVDYDYAILHLKDPYRYTPAINYVKLAKKMDVPVGTDMFVMGWGTTVPRRYTLNNTNPATKGAQIPMLKGITLKMQNFQDCKRNYSSINVTITVRFFCASSSMGDTCKGDSGAPIVVNKVQYGINSFGVGCFRASYPSVFAQVPLVYDWISTTAGASRIIGRVGLIYFANLIVKFA